MVKERQVRGKGREVNKVFCSLLVGALWQVVHIRRRPGTKGSQLRPLGLVHWQASWPLSTLTSQDVSLSEEESHQSRHLLQEGGPLPGPETGLLSNTLKRIVLGDTCADKARDFIGKGTRVESRRVREPRRTSLPRGSQSGVVWWFYGDGISFLWSLASHSMFSLYWWRQDGCQREGFWEVDGHTVSPFALS